MIAKMMGTRKRILMTVRTQTSHQQKSVVKANKILIDYIMITINNKMNRMTISATMQ